MVRVSVVAGYCTATRYHLTSQYHKQDVSGETRTGGPNKEVVVQEKIGETAGRIWLRLKKGEEISVAQLPKTLNEKDAVVYQALGWLAREGKVKYRTERNRTFVSVAE